MARHSIGDAMSNILATDKLLSRQRSLWGASLLPLPSSAGDNRPYISNLAGKLAGAQLCSRHRNRPVGMRCCASDDERKLVPVYTGGDL